LPIVGITNPSTIGGEFFKIPNQRFYQVGNSTVGIVDVTTVNHDFLATWTKLIPLFGILNGLVYDLKVGLKIGLT